LSKLIFACWLASAAMVGFCIGVVFRDDFWQRATVKQGAACWYTNIDGRPDWRWLSRDERTIFVPRRGGFGNELRAD